MQLVMEVLELFSNGRKSAESTLYIAVTSILFSCLAVSSIFFNSWHVCFII